MPSLPVIIVAFMIVLAALMMLHQRSRAQNVVSPIEVLLGTPPGPAGEIQAITQGPVTVYVPPQATSEQGTIFISLASPDLALVEDNSGWNRAYVVNVEFRNPSGMTLPEMSFNEPVEICFNLTQEEWQAFMAQTDAYQVQHFDDRANPPAWVRLPEKTYPARRQLCGQTSHLSLFALANSLEVPPAGPTSVVNPGYGTIVPTRTSVSVQPTRPRRDGASSGGGLGPTSLPATRIPPTATRVPPTATPVPPTATSVPPTQVPPTTAVPLPTLTEEPTEPIPSEEPTEATLEPDPLSFLEPIITLIAPP